MKKSALIILMFYTFKTYSQTNLVPNGGYEQYVTCPTGTGQSNLASGWYILNQTPDYFNSCSMVTCNCYTVGNICAGVPSNCFGYQPAASGDGYQGFCVYSTATASYREMIGAQLSNTMQIGQKYYVKFKIAFTLIGNSNSAVDKTGVKFSTIQHSVSNPPPLNNFAHVFANAIVSDTLNWTTIFQSFIADSNYKYVEVGNFYTNSALNVSVMRPQATNLSYYYFDELCVSTDSAFVTNFTTDVRETIADKLLFSPNPSNGQIRLVNYQQRTSISIDNLMGQNVKNISDVRGQEVDLDLPDGLYLITIYEGDKKYSRKIIIKSD